MKKAKKIFFSRTTFKYLFVGGLTSFINLTIFTLLTRNLKLEVTISNIISVLITITSAYILNKLFVFCSHCDSFLHLCIEFFKFFSARLITMIVEIGGVFLTVNVIGQQAIIGKLESQVIVIAGNYLISKYFVFNRKAKKAT